MRPAPALAVPCNCSHKLQLGLGLEGALLPCVWQAVLRSPPPPGPSNLLMTLSHTALPGKPAAVARSRAARTAGLPRQPRAASEACAEPCVEVTSCSWRRLVPLVLPLLPGQAHRGRQEADRALEGRCRAQGPLEALPGQ